MHKRLENYLNQLRSQLETLPAEKREAELREIRQHLETLIADYQREGLSEEAAINKAIEQFGNPKMNGKHLSRVWGRDVLLRRNAFRRASIAFSVVITSFLLVFISLFTFYAAVHPASRSATGLDWIDRQHELEVQKIQTRWKTDNFDIQHMNPRNVAAVSKAQVESMNRVNSAMTASANRWQSRMEEYQRENYTSDVLYAVVGGVLLSGLLAALLMVTFRLLGTRNSGRMSVS